MSPVKRRLSRDSRKDRQLVISISSDAYEEFESRGVMYILAIWSDFLEVSRILNA